MLRTVFCVLLSALMLLSWSLRASDASFEADLGVSSIRCTPTHFPCSSDDPGRLAFDATMGLNLNIDLDAKIETEILPRFGIAMTTIPPRFAHLHESLTSWLRQDSISPSIILIFVPSYYRRFKSKSRSKSSPESYKTMLERALRAKNDALISTALDSGVITIVEILNDWGPISRIVGLLQYVKDMEQLEIDQVTSTSASTHEVSNNGSLPDYWIVGDDDVRYVNDLILRYNFVIGMRHALCISQGHSSSNCNNQSHEDEIDGSFSPVPNSNPNNPFSNVGLGFSRLVLSQFVADYRLILSLPHVTSDSNSNSNNSSSNNNNNLGSMADSELVPRRVAHLQAVDSYLLPSAMLANQLRDLLPFSAPLVKGLIREMHTTCPLSFYQDDYVVSFMLSISGVAVTSIWNNNKANDHIEGVSRNNHQMHMDSMVFQRELDTKLCLTKNAKYFLQFMLSERQRMKDDRMKSEG